MLPGKTARVPDGSTAAEPAGNPNTIVGGTSSVHLLEQSRRGERLNGTGLFVSFLRIEKERFVTFRDRNYHHSREIIKIETISSCSPV